MSKLKIFGVALAGVVGALGLAVYLQEDLPPLLQSFVSAAQNGTTLTVTKTADGHKVRTFGWTIDKTATPTMLNMFRGDDSSVQYTVTATKDEGQDKYYVSGEICVTNGGVQKTENLRIVDEVQFKSGAGQFMPLVSQPVDLSIMPVIGAGKIQCYPYRVDFVAVEGAVYRNVAKVTIENHSGWLPNGNNCPGITPCPFGPEEKADFSLPSSPDAIVNGTINVDDGGRSWAFSATGTQQYSTLYRCNEDSGVRENTARIRETNQSATASVSVMCYELQVQKNVHLSYRRTYLWDINKEADRADIVLSVGQELPLNYAVTVRSTGHEDSNWLATGSIDIQNPAPMEASLVGVYDTFDGPVAAEVDCPEMVVAPGAVLTCAYTASLPDGTNRTNTAVAVLQNNNGGATSFFGNAQADFSNASVEQVDDMVMVEDTFAGNLGAVSVNYGEPMKVFSYVRNVGPYEACGVQAVLDNTATFTTNDSGLTGSASRSVPVRVPCLGCTLTIGFWKTHAGFGPQKDVLTQYLPIWLGTPVGAKSVQVTTATQAVDILNKRSDASNGLNKLSAQLLAVKLNIANDADGTAAAALIAQADNYLAMYGADDWTKLKKADRTAINTLATKLDGYNNGLIGPGHCSE